MGRRGIIAYITTWELEGCAVDREVAKRDPPVGAPSSEAQLWRFNDYNI